MENVETRLVAFNASSLVFAKWKFQSLKRGIYWILTNCKNIVKQVENSFIKQSARWSQTSGEIASKSKET